MKTGLIVIGLLAAGGLAAAILGCESGNEFGRRYAQPAPAAYRAAEPPPVAYEAVRPPAPPREEVCRRHADDRVGRRHAARPSRPNGETYDDLADNPFLAVADNPLSTFSIDVDTASYSNVRRFIHEGRLPPPGAVRIEELVNYFRYDDAPPADGQPFAVHLESADCPWRPDHRLVRIAIKGRELRADRRPPANLVFLLDVSGSMSDANKLPLVREGMKLLVNRLDKRDRVAIVTYAGSAGVALDSTAGHHRWTLRCAIDRLKAGGMTAGGAGLQLAYRMAAEHFIGDGINRVILCTDGDFNVGVTDPDELADLVAAKARGGVFLTVLGFGMGNLKDATLEKLADRGNGNYGYVDTLDEARKLLVEQLSGTLATLAKDVKVQVEFNPARASAYRLIGYENRVLAEEDFNDDAADAGELGAGHTVTALYEVAPAGGEFARPRVDPLKYQRLGAAPARAVSDELMTVKLRYKQPWATVSEMRQYPLIDRGADLRHATRDFRFAAAVAAFGMALRQSPHRGNASFEQAIELAGDGRGADRDGRRAEFIELARKAAALSRD